MTIIIGIKVHDDEGVVASMEDKMVRVVVVFNAGAKDTPFVGVIF